MRHLFIVDPLPRLLVDADTSIAFMREASRRGHEVWTTQVDDLRVGEGGRPHARAAETFVKDGEPWYELGRQALEACDAFDVVWMRKDPPVDLDFIQAVRLLTLVGPPALVVNDPFGLLAIEEKLFVLRFPELAPPTIVSRDRAELLAFCERLGGEMIVKPIGGSGGEGVFHIVRDDRNLRARQRLWQHQVPFFDVVGWVLGLAGLAPGMRVLDAGCGNGAYLRALAGYPVRAAGCDLSAGMLRAVPYPALFCADVAALPVRDGSFDVVLAAHMLYHVPDRRAAVGELRRVLVPAGVCIAVTNGADHLRPLRALVERAARKGTPGWSMQAATQAFTTQNATAQLSHAFASVTLVRPARQPPVVIRDASVVADYVASWAGFYQDQVARPWADVVADVRQEVQAVIDGEGTFTASGDLVAFVCR